MEYIINNVVYQQKNSAAPTVPSNYFFNIGVYSDVTLDAYIVWPFFFASHSIFLSRANGFDFSQSFTTQQDLQQVFPFGIYHFQIDVLLANPPPFAFTSWRDIGYQADHFTTSIPVITNYNKLYGFDSTKDFTVTFNSFTPDKDTTGFTIFDIWDDGHHLVFSSGDLDHSVTSLVIPANKLAPNHNYTFELDFSDRLGAATPTFGDVTQQGFDVRTDGSFITGANKADDLSGSAKKDDPFLAAAQKAVDGNWNKVDTLAHDIMAAFGTVSTTVLDKDDPKTAVDEGHHFNLVGQKDFLNESVSLVKALDVNYAKTTTQNWTNADQLKIVVDGGPNPNLPKGPIAIATFDADHHYQTDLSLAHAAIFLGYGVGGFYMLDQNAQDDPKTAVNEGEAQVHFRAFDERVVNGVTTAELYYTIGLI